MHVLISGEGGERGGLIIRWERRMCSAEGFDNLL